MFLFCYLKSVISGRDVIFMGRVYESLFLSCLRVKYMSSLLVKFKGRVHDRCLRAEFTGHVYVSNLRVEFTGHVFISMLWAKLMGLAYKRV